MPQIVALLTAELPGPIRFSEAEAMLHVQDDEIAFALWLRADLEVVEQTKLHATILPDQKTKVEVRYRRVGDGPQIGDNQVAIVVSSVRAAQEQIRSEFAQFLNNQSFLSEGNVTYRTEPHLLEEIWELRTDIMEPVELGASPQLAELRNSVVGDLWTIGKQAANWLWWRTSGRGELSVRKGPFYWSSDGKNWLMLPTAVANHGEVIPSIKIDAGIQKDFANHEVWPIRMPLGRELFHESWRLMHDQPRSALLLAIAAAEVGFKEWASSIAPDTAWLFENIQSPPLDKLLGELFPKLAADKFSVILPTGMSKQHLVKVIRRGVEVRNTIAHSPPSSRRYQNASHFLDYANLGEFQELLLCVSDLLWILDYLWLRSNNLQANWALERARPTSRSSLGLEGYLA